MADAAFASPRRTQLAGNLDRVRARLAAACAAAGRDPDEVCLVAVTKNCPAADVVHLAALGVLDIGENRDQEASAKAAEVAAAGVAVRWHFVGRLQRNKCRSVAGYADLVHSVDRAGLVPALAGAVARSARAPLDVLVQVSLDGDPRRGGAVYTGTSTLARADPEADLARLLDLVDATAQLNLCGLMAVAPPEWEPVRSFALLAQIAAWARSVHPGARLLSAGMSVDLEAAITHGATHVRVGSALLGNRPAPGVT